MARTLRLFQLAALLASAVHGLSTEPQARALQTYATAKDAQDELLKQVNAARVQAGVAALCSSPKLVAAAQIHADDEAKHNAMSHMGTDGSTLSARINAQSFSWVTVGENVAAGFADVSAVMAAWLASPAHRANIVNANFNFFGGGYAYDAASDYGHYWTQNFAASKNETCMPPVAVVSLVSNPAPVVATVGPASSLAPVQTTATPDSTANATVAGTSEQESGIDYFGDDLGSVQATNVADCKHACYSTAQCLAYTFVADVCYLKTGVGTKQTNAAATSGVVACGVQLTDTDFYGSDLINQGSSSATECCKSCAVTSGCKGYTFVTDTCFLKKSINTPINRYGAISGAVVAL